MKEKLVITIDGELKKKAKIKCIERGTNLSKIIGEFLRKWVSDA